MTVPNVLLNNGALLPMIGLGTWRSPPDIATQAVRDALEVGYRHIDCAHIYGNEPEVGLAIEETLAQGQIKREHIFITSKLWSTFHHPSMVRTACERSLKNLRIDYVDNYLIHWPTAFKDGEILHPKDADGKMIYSDVDYVDTWCAMEQLVDAGLCRSIGISNFNKAQIERILKVARIKPANLQIECHPYLNQSRLMEFCRAHNIAVTAYSPLGSSHTPYEKPGEYSLMKHPVVVEIAEEHKRTPAQVLIRYQIQRGNVVIPRSVNKAHMAANLSVCDFELSEMDLSELNKLDFNGRIMSWTVASGHPHHPFENDEY